MGFYNAAKIQSFFNAHTSALTEAPPSFWQKAIPAACELGFGVGEFSDDRIVIVTPEKERRIYQGFKQDATPTTLGIVLTHAILTTKLH